MTVWTGKNLSSLLLSLILLELCFVVYRTVLRLTVGTDVKIMLMIFCGPCMVLSLCGPCMLLSLCGPCVVLSLSGPCMLLSLCGPCMVLSLCTAVQEVIGSHRHSDAVSWRRLSGSCHGNVQVSSAVLPRSPAPWTSADCTDIVSCHVNIETTTWRI